MAAFAVTPLAAHAAPGMLVGIEQNGGMPEAGQRTENLDAMRGLGAQVIRFVLRYDRIATCDPSTNGAPPTAPNNPCYDFSVPDQVVVGASSRGMQVIFSIVGTPSWQFGKKFNYVGSSQAEFQRFSANYADFAQAAAVRYSGAMGIPRVNYWTIWNEPNNSYFWLPRYQGKTLVAPQRYAALYNAAATRIKQVDPQLQVAPGPTAPSPTGLKPANFIRLAAPVLTQLGAPIDAWAHNGYTRRQAPLASTMKLPEIGMGNLGALTRLLDGYRSTKGKPIWITEFSFETKPDAAGVTDEQQSHWLAEATYVAWSNPRVHMFVWYALFDDGSAEAPQSGFQSGLYYNFSQCPTKWCAKPASMMFQHPIWVSANTVKLGKSVTIWAHGRIAPAQTKIFVWQGAKWEQFANQTPYSDGSLFVTFQPTNDTWFVTCDTSCGPIQKVTVTS